MKSLNEYIENNIIDLDINDSLDLHFYAEFVLRDSMRHTITKIKVSITITILYPTRSIILPTIGEAKKQVIAEIANNKLIVAALAP